MKTSTLLRTKFIIPPVNADHLPRPHLLDWLEKHAGRRLILISAPPGYGKTTLLSACGLSRQMVAGQPVAWFQLDPGDSDPTIFLTHLIESLRPASREHNAPGQAALTLLESTAPEASLDPRRIMTVLVNELAEQITAAFTLVLEDYHFIASPVVHQLVDFLLENGPAGLKVILSTRSDPPLALARLRARGLLAELRASDLRFRDDEVSALITRDMPGLSNHSLALLSEKTEGWAAALQIVRSSLSGRDLHSANQAIANLNGSHRFVFDYLADEVFRRLPAENQDFLLKTSVFSQMDAAACTAISGVQDAQAMLDDLEKQNLFLTSLDPQRRWFRYHTLFREFLLSKLRREQAQQVSLLEHQAGDYYEHHAEPETAFRHFLRAGDESAAARVALIFAADYAERGRAEALHHALGSLSIETMRAYPELLLQDGNAHRRLGDAGPATTAYEEARAAFAARDNPGGVSRAITRLAEVQRAEGNYRPSESLAKQALAAAPLNDHLARAEALMALAKSTGFLTGMDEGRARAEQAVEEARLAGDILSALARASFLQSLGQICWWHGDPQATVRYCQEALHLAPDQVSPTTAQAHISLVSPHLYWRELDLALKHAEQGLEIAQTLQLNELLPAAYTALGNVLTRLGETARAEAVLHQSVDMAQHLGLASYELLMATGYLAYNLYGQGRVDEAWQLAEGALWSYTGNPDAYEAFVCRSVLADVALEKGQLNRAENLFNEILEAGKRRQFRIPLAMVYFGLAYIHLMTERRESGLENAREALRLIAPTRAVQLFIDQGDRTRVVCDALLQAGETHPFIEKVIEQMPSKRKTSKISLLDESAVVIQCLGDFHVTVGGQEISQERWVSAKARDLLAYFVTFRRERIPADRAFEAIWADKGGRGLTAFHTALSRLRSALRVQGSETSPRLILVESGDYRLDVARFRIDADEFDTALAKARAAATPEAAEWLAQAINLYRGEYFQNLYYDWLMPERRRLSQAYLGALRALGEHHYTHQRYTRALELLQRALRVDNLLEDLHCQSMRVYAALGDRAGLVRQYQELKDVLRDELAMEPLASTNQLYDRLLRE
jgi:LuxR family maltose regulon positive regulatory protein